MKKNLLLITTCVAVTFLVACQPQKKQPTASSQTQENDVTQVTSDSNPTMDGIWKTQDDAKQTFTLSIDGQTLAYQGENETARATYDPLRIKEGKSKGKNEQLWEFIPDQKEVTVTEKYREADPIFIDSNKEIKELFMANTAAIPETIRINRDNNTISYTLKNDNEDVKNLVKGATLTFNSQSQKLVYTSPYGDTFKLVQVNK